MSEGKTSKQASGEVGRANRQPVVQSSTSAAPRPSDVARSAYTKNVMIAGKPVPAPEQVRRRA